jgi:hypothetical protein
VSGAVIKASEFSKLLTDCVHGRITSDDMVEAELFRLHGLGRVIRLDYRGGRVFLGVVRLMVGKFAFINFFKTGALHKELDAIVKAQAIR